MDMYTASVPTYNIYHLVRYIGRSITIPWLLRYPVPLLSVSPQEPPKTKLDHWSLAGQHRPWTFAWRNIHGNVISHSTVNTVYMYMYGNVIMLVLYCIILTGKLLTQKLTDYFYTCTCIYIGATGHKKWA